MERRLELGLLCAALAGCGGAGLNVVQSPFAGTYAGTYEAQSGNSSGEANVKADTAGVVSGVIKQIQPTIVSGVVAGKVGISGDFLGNIALGAGPSRRLSGGFAFDTKGKLTVDALIDQDGNLIPIRFELGRL